MEHFNLSCQLCLTTFKWLNQAKTHFHSTEHEKKVKEFFQGDVFNDCGYLPYIVVLAPKTKQDPSPLIIGSSLLTFCFSGRSKSSFYLCHVCDEKCSSEVILSHLSHGDHCSNYFNYTDPNVVSYSWIPSMDMRVILRTRLAQDIEAKGPGTLQLLELPKRLLQKLEASTYSEVINQLGELNGFNKLLEAVRPKRTMIQTFQRDSQRRHPLLGMQHIVECVCDGAPEKRHYLCTLCKLTFSTHMIIKHILSFDHIFCYFRVWHPSTLQSKESYNNYSYFASEILDLSKQAEEILANTEIKKITLEPDEFASVNFACYAEALKLLESKRNDNKESSLIVSVQPGDKLVYVGHRTEPKESYSVFLRCQHCRLTCKKLFHYFKHLSDKRHDRMLMECFHKAKTDGGYEQAGTNPFLFLYRYLRDTSKENQPVIGTSLIVTCISLGVKDINIYVCFACEKSFTGCILQKHLESTCHIINTLMYQNPWSLPFAWESHLDMKDLKSVAWEEEKERETNVLVMKVFDIPQSIFFDLLPPTYEKVMNRLQLYHTSIRDAVPQRQTYRKLKQNERFPLLGKQFMVMYDVKNDERIREAFLCLLCERKLSKDESCSHVFSQEHVKRFLDCHHPGSVTSGIDAETLLDLAKQAARVHPISNVQVIKMDRPIWEPCTYVRAKSILETAKKKFILEALEPQIKPKMKLVPRKPVKEKTWDDVIDQQSTGSINLIKKSENSNGKNSINCDNDLKTKEVEPEMIKCSVKPKEPIEEGKEILAPSEIISEKREPFTETTSRKLENKGSDPGQPLKEDAHKTRKSSGDNTFKSQKREKDCAQVDKENVKSSEGCIYKSKEKNTSKKNKDQIKPDENAGEEIGCLAQNFDSIHGSGEAKVVELTEDMHNKIKQDFKSAFAALHTAKSFQTQEAGSSKLPSPQSGVKPSDASITQHGETEWTEKNQTAATDDSQHKIPHTEHLQSPTAKTKDCKTKPNETPPKVGVNHLIIVSCERRQQVYCELCSVRLRNSSHTYSDVHRLNYVKLKYPEMNSEAFESPMILDSVVAHLAEVEKGVTHRRSQSIQVTRDVYKELAALPEDKAIEKLKIIIKQPATTDPTADGPEAFRQASLVSSISPFEMSSPDDGHTGSGPAHVDVRLHHSNQPTTTTEQPEKNLPQDKVLGFSSTHQREPEKKEEPKKPMYKSSGAIPETPSHIQRLNAAVASSRSCSKLSTYLTVKNLEAEAIIGMGSVWECQGISRNTFYLCENCKDTISVKKICRHMLSQAHQIQCMRKDYSPFLYFLKMDNVPQEVKDNILLDIALMFSAQERFKKIDAQVVMLTDELYERVQAAPFHEALSMVKTIKGEKGRSLFRPVLSQGKQPEKQWVLNKFHQTDLMSGLERTDHGHDNEARHKPETYHLDQTGVVRDNITNNLGPVDVSAMKHKVSTETNGISSMQPELDPRDSQRPVPELQVQREEEPSQSPSFPGNMKTSQTSVSVDDTQLPRRKRPASPPVESFETTNPHLKDPSQPKYARSSLQDVSQCSADSASNSTPGKPATMSSDKDTAAGCSDGGADATRIGQLIELVKKEKEKQEEDVFCCISAPFHHVLAANNLSPVEGRRHSLTTPMSTGSNAANITGRF